MKVFDWISINSSQALRSFSLRFNCDFINGPFVSNQIAYYNSGWTHADIACDVALKRKKKK